MTPQRIVIAIAVAASLALLFLLPRLFERQEPPAVAPIELRLPKSPDGAPD
jgi:hypothetical protein